MRTDKKIKKGDGRTEKASPVYIVSGGFGASGEQIVETVLAQFPDSRVPVVSVAHVRQMKQIEEVVEKALATGGTIVHTLVDNDLREALIRLGKKHKIVTIDLMGPCLHA